ncbi:hypothetical protein VTH06DRAFT_6978 [Thermothelomyces fergusii]
MDHDRMEIDPPDPPDAAAAAGAMAGTETAAAKRKGHPTRTRTLATITVRSPPWSYAHLAVANPPRAAGATSPAPAPAPVPDMLEIRAYLTAALRQFLGDTGAAIPVDILAVGRGDGDGDSSGVWVRVPRQDLNLFVGAVTAFAGLPTSSTVGSGQGAGEERMVLQVRAAGNWLGSLLGRGDEGKLWAGSGTSDEGGS